MKRVLSNTKVFDCDEEGCGNVAVYVFDGLDFNVPYFVYRCELHDKIPSAVPFLNPDVQTLIDTSYYIQPTREVVDSPPLYSSTSLYVFLHERGLKPTMVNIQKYGNSKEYEKWRKLNGHAHWR